MCSRRAAPCGFAIGATRYRCFQLRTTLELLCTFDNCRHTDYNVGMNTTQYTIRSVPKALDVFLRRQATARGKSLNQTVLDYIEQATKLDMQESDDDFAWLIGANTLDSKSLKAISDLKEGDKQKSRL